MPGEMSEHTARRSAPASIKFSVKYPVPAPISRPWSNAGSSRAPSALRSFPSTWPWPVSPKSMPHLPSYSSAAASW